MSEELVELVNKAMHGGFNQYAPMPGYLPLKETIAEKIKYLYNTDIDPVKRSRSHREERMQFILL